MLLRVVTRLAQDQLEKNAGFIPFGAVSGSKRDVKLLMPEGWRKNCTEEEVQSYWSKELKKHAGKDGCRAVCYCAHVGVPTAGDQYAPAILIHLEHCEAAADDVMYPYHMGTDSKAVLGKGGSLRTEGRVFPCGKEIEGESL